MRPKSPSLWLSLLCLSAIPSHAILYWDSNGPTAGAGATPAGAWGTNNFWSTDPNGGAATAAWTVGDTAVFSAGTDATSAFTVNLSAPQTAAGVTVEEGTVSLTGSALTISGAGVIAVNSGAVFSIPNMGNVLYPGAGGTVQLNGGTFRNTIAGVGSQILTANAGIVIGAAGGTIDIPTAGSTVFNGVISGPGNTLTKTGIGEFRGLSNWTFSKLVVNQGLYRINGTGGTETGFGAVPGAVTADAITVANGAAIGTSVGITTPVQRGITVTSGVATLVLSSGWTINSVITGAGGIALNGNGFTGTNQQLTLGTVNTYQGSTTINLGTINVSVPGALPATTALIFGAPGVATNETLTVAQNQTVASLSGGNANGGVVTVSASRTFTAGDASNTTYAGNLNGAGAFTKQGSGILTIQGFDWGNTGDTTINAGALKFGNSAAGFSNTSQLILGAAGTLDMNGVTDSIGSLAGSGNIINGANLTLAGNNVTPAVYSGNYTGAAASRILTKNGTGIQALTGSNNFTAVNFNDGRIEVGHSNAVGSGTMAVAAGADELVSTAPGIVLANNVTLAASALRIYATTGNSLTLNGVISGAGGLLRNDTGAGTLTLNGANTFGGGFKISSRDIFVGHKAGFGTGTLTIGDDVIAPANPIVINATANLSGASAVANPIALNQDFTISGDNLEFSADFDLNGNRTITTNNAAGKATIFSGNITGGGFFIKEGLGTLVLAGPSTYTAATIANAGTLRVTGSLTGTASVDILGTLEGTGTITPASAGSVTIIGGGKLSPGIGGIGTLTVNLSGFGKVDISPGADAEGSHSLLFDLNSSGASDKVVSTGGVLDIGGVLEFDDFVFNLQPGFTLSDITDFTLFDGSAAIVGTFGPNISGSVGGYEGHLQFADGGNDLVLQVLPEPGSVALLLGGLGLLAGRRRRSFSGGSDSSASSDQG
jgi:autotransporter-associated beta strand protein